MDLIPFVGTTIDKDGRQYVLIRQTASDGQLSVSICLTMEQFSCLMAVLRGLEMYFMDTELKKPVDNFPGIDDLPHQRTPSNMETSFNETQYNPESPTYTLDDLSLLPERPIELSSDEKKRKANKRKSKSKEKAEKASKINV